MKLLRKKLAAEEGGFTLAEVLVTMLMMLTVMAALHSIFSTSLRVFSFGNDKVEAVQNARLGLERMEREIRGAYSSDGEILLTTEPERISFYLSTGSEASDTTRITYEMYDSSTGDALGRSEGDGKNRAVSQFVEDLEFSYMDENGDETEEESKMQMVRILLEINTGEPDDPVTQELTTEVYLRNRSE